MRSAKKVLEETQATLLSRDTTLAELRRQVESRSAMHGALQAAQVTQLEKRVAELEAEKKSEVAGRIAQEQRLKQQCAAAEKRLSTTEAEVRRLRDKLSAATAASEEFKNKMEPFVAAERACRQHAVKNGALTVRPRGGEKGMDEFFTEVKLAKLQKEGDAIAARGAARARMKVATLQYADSLEAEIARSAQAVYAAQQSEERRRRGAGLAHSSSLPSM